jgi:hypothetical protein
MPGESLHVLGMEFLRRVETAIPLAYDAVEVFAPWQNPDFEATRFPDLIAKLVDGSVLLIEARNYSPGTSYRVDELVTIMHELVEDYRARRPNEGTPKPVLVISGTLSHIQYEKLVRAGISLIDGPALDALDRRPVNALITGIGRDSSGGLGPSGRELKSRRLSRELTSLTPGRRDWAIYQRLCGDIFQYAFCPPLETPISERSNRSGVNRRDYILPNYATNGFWRFARAKYGADHVVVDAKNNATPLKKESVLQMANYLNEWGCGLFGILATRLGAARSAIEVVREQWIMHKKLILVLDDGDITQILEMKGTKSKPEYLIQQRIEDFRLSI